MRVVVVGLGVQGRKRSRVAGADVVATVDPVVPEATHRSLADVPTDAYDAALVCVPDAAKLNLLHGLVAAGKHALVEKPLVAPGAGDLGELERAAHAARVAVYAAYNHRFEPHLVRVRELLREGAVGEPYRLSLFYGNGTARDVRSSPWRDQGLGVVTDLAPHLLDLCLFFLGQPEPPLQAWSSERHENAAPDHFVFGFPRARPAVTLEGSLLSWRNTFRLDLIGSEGSAHVDGLCKWGPSVLTLRGRVLPSGRPPEEAWRLEQADPTWEAEYAHFSARCAGGSTDLEADRWIDRMLSSLGAGVRPA